MTFFIAICDDEKRICAELENALADILGKMNAQCEIDIYFTGEELCRKMEAGKIYNLIFLDIEFAKNAINGVEAGRLIREAHQNNMAAIVYISWKMKYSMQLFDIRPFNFLLKPLSYTKIEAVIRTYLNLAKQWSHDFTYKIGHDTYKVPIKDITHLQSDKRKITLYLADGKTAEFYGTLKEVYQEQLKGHDFLFIHASYIVNYDFIAAVKFNEVVLSNGSASLPISKPRRPEVRDAYCAIMEKRRV